MIEQLATKLTDPRFLAMIFAAVAAIATVITFALPLLAGDSLDKRMKSVALEREKMRQRERERMSRQEKVTLRVSPKAYMQTAVERFNLTLRMTLRRFTRLTNGHSKSPAHHAAMQAIFLAFYNFCRKHEALQGATPAMAAGITDRIWTVRGLIEHAAEC